MQIQQLEKCLKDQFVVRQALEKALWHKSSAIDTSIDGYIPKVVHLEQYLLSLYRRAFEQRISNVSPAAVEDVKKQQLISQSAPFPEAATHDIPFRKAESAFRSSHILLPRKSANKLCNEACPVNCQEKHGRGIHRSHSSLVPRSVCSAKWLPSAKNLARALGACHTLPLSLLKPKAHLEYGIPGSNIKKTSLIIKVGLYSPKRLFHQLESAKMEYIHATVTIRKGYKILLPRLVDFFAKDSNQSTQELLDMIKCYLPERLRLVINGCNESSCRKIIQWVPHNFSF
ncbi:hypothetical protein BHE74_00020865, partial [Ensete ventricosum]